MKSSMILLFIALLCSSCGSRPVISLWEADAAVQLFGTAGTDECSAIHIEDEMALYLGGHVNADSSNGLINYKGTPKGFLNKYSYDGSLLWTRYMSDLGKDYVTDVATDTDGNIYVIGKSYNDTMGPRVTQKGKERYYSSAYLKKFDALGNVLIEKRLYHTASAERISITRSGKIYISGKMYPKKHEQDPKVMTNSCLFVSEYNASGTQIWRNVYGTIHNDEITAMHVTNNGIVYLSGYAREFEMRKNKQGKMVRTRTLGEKDGFLMCLGKNGEVKWRRDIQNKNHDEVSDLLVVDDSSIYITGLRSRGISREDRLKGVINDECFVEKLDALGRLIWSISVGTEGSHAGDCLTINQHGDIVVFGRTRSGERDGKPIHHSRSNDVFVATIHSINGEITDYNIFNVPHWDEASQAVQFNGDIIFTAKTCWNWSGVINKHKGSSEIVLHNLTQRPLDSKHVSPVRSE